MSDLSKPEHQAFENMIDEHFAEMSKMLKDIHANLKHWHPHEAMLYYKTMKTVIFNTNIHLYEIKNKRQSEGDDILKQIN